MLDGEQAGLARHGQHLHGLLELAVGLAGEHAGGDVELGGADRLGDSAGQGQALGLVAQFLPRAGGFGRSASLGGLGGLAAGGGRLGAWRRRGRGLRQRRQAGQQQAACGQCGYPGLGPGRPGVAPCGKGDGRAGWVHSGFSVAATGSDRDFACRAGAGQRSARRGGAAIRPWASADSASPLAVWPGLSALRGIVNQPLGRP